MSISSIIVLICSGVIISSIISYFITGHILYVFSVRRKALVGRVIERQLSKNLDKYKIDRDWWENKNIEELTLETDKDALAGYLIRSKKKTDKVAILIHGYCSSHRDLSAQAKIFLKNNFHIFAPDLRAHGKSSGKIIGMGGYDKNDMLLWIDKIIKLFGKKTKIALFGLSMGGATVCLLSGENLPKNVQCIVSDCAYDSLEKQFKFVLKQKIRLPEFPLFKIAKRYIKLKAKYNLDDIRPVDAVAKSQLPILFIHGTEDELVPFEMAENLYNSSNNPKTEFYPVKNAGHALSFAKDTEKYESVVMNFVNNNITDII